MTSTACPFCTIGIDRVFYAGPLVIGFWDAFPVNPGHALLAPRRHIASWFDATPAERAELMEATIAAREAIARANPADGFNIGINIGAAAGQTVGHLHVHVIPRVAGDVPDPRGGVRHVIPARGNYLAPSAGARTSGEGGPPLVTGEDDPLLPHLIACLARAEHADIAVGFVQDSGVRRLEAHLQDLLARGGQLRILTGDYLDITDPTALVRLLDLDGDIQRRMFQTARTGGSFHPKAYIFQSRDGSGAAFVGSSNLSEMALSDGVEWNYRVVTQRDALGFSAVTQAFEALFQHPATTPLTDEWVTGYRARRRVVPGVASPAEVPLEPPAAAATPHEIQQQALAALEQTREVGNTAGLVVLATGLGKTWLSAFDSNRPEYRRVLFVAHREEILDQARHTFRQVRPEARLGLYTGTEKASDADVLFASIQTLGRAHHLAGFDPQRFDYLVVDEFHHASAATYRRLIAHFRPKFLLGLTATPERRDGGDLLALCQENLAYRCDLAEGIRKQLLCPFHYFGVPDEVDYRNIPWRNNRFDEDALTQAWATQARAENALEQYRTRGGHRTLGFCVSQRHADFMARFFSERGIEARAVHSGETSAPRTATLEDLSAGKLPVVFAVDMFNEGVDLPTLDTVMMLRPTGSRVVWLQQFGRGLRVAPDKPHLTVIDYIGNHRSFLLKPQTLFDLAPGDREVLLALERVATGAADLPPGCEVTYDLRAIDILRGLLRDGGSQIDALKRFYEDFEAQHGVRPTATEVYHDGYNPRAVRPTHGSWLRFVKSMGGLTDEQGRALDATAAFLDALEVTPMTRSYKMLVLLAMLEAERLPGGVTIDELVAGVQVLAGRMLRLRHEFGAAVGDAAEMRRLLETNPIPAWVEGKGTGGLAFFRFDGRRFETTFAAAVGAEAEAVADLVREIVDWRLAEYLQRDSDSATDIICKVSHASGRPILFLPERATQPGIPEGWTPVTADSQQYEANFVKVAVNVLRKPGTDQNELPSLLRGWFGPDAGAPGTAHRVVFQPIDGGYRLQPIGGRARAGALVKWRAYSREEIPPLFGLEFSEAHWNQGHVSLGGHQFLLVSLEKHGQQEQFQYADHFVSPTEFEWQSQNRATQTNTYGERVKNHRVRGEAVHLFVRRQRKVNGTSAPFIYCGEVDFASWEGEQPITVRWRLKDAVPERLWAELKVPGASATRG